MNKENGQIFNTGQMKILEKFWKENGTGKDGMFPGWDVPKQENVIPMEIEPTEKQMSRKPYPKVGRNDPCPCGSGKKFKKCCLILG